MNNRRAPRSRSGKNYHVRRRNVALGVTAVGILMHSNLITGQGIGGAVMNDVGRRR